jgi:hypothetical protein
VSAAPSRGWSDDIADESPLRLAFDDRAGFAWGTSWVYLIVPREELAPGDLSREVVTGGDS